MELKINSAKNIHRLPAATKIRQLNRIAVVVVSTMSRSHKNHTTFFFQVPHHSSSVSRRERARERKRPTKQQYHQKTSFFASSRKPVSYSAETEENTQSLGPENTPHTSPNSRRTLRLS
jgi:hypothetical protein